MEAAERAEVSLLGMLGVVVTWCWVTTTESKEEPADGIAEEEREVPSGTIFWMVT